MSYKKRIYQLEALSEHGRASMFDMEELYELYDKQELLELEREYKTIWILKDNKIEATLRKEKTRDRVIELKKKLGLWER